MQKGLNRRILGVGDLTPLAQSYIGMRKDVVDGRLEYDWPLAGSQLRIELLSTEDRKIRFFMDVYEGRRESTVILGAAPQRKATTQSRAASMPYVRVDMADEHEALRHINPDGSEVVGSHVHLDLTGYGIKWAWPLNAQDILQPVDGSYSIQSMFESMLDANHVTKLLRIKYSLGV
ncbi:MAG: hypothetical protein IKE22_05340 [Atopobiaceae bacterium]|nr:hypothetical protein [Atopobiaceae bacterium]